MIEAGRTYFDSSILVVDDEDSNLDLMESILREHLSEYEVRSFSKAQSAINSAIEEPPDLILLDILMPEIDGFEVCKRLKANVKIRDIPIIFISALNEKKDKVAAFKMGGYDYITKPFEPEEVVARVTTHLKLRRLQVNLEGLVQEQVKEITDSRIATIVALSSLAEHRDEDTGKHICRVQTYCRTLAQHLSAQPEFSTNIDNDFIENIYHASAMHDIGKVGIPDDILYKSEKLTPTEYSTMKKHTTLGAKTLSVAINSYPNNKLIMMGKEIALTHHERWDGSGYPHGLKGEAIPLAGRIMNIADQYDAMRNKRPYKPPFDHDKTFKIITNGDGRTMPDHFDPRILDAFKSLANEFNDIYESFMDYL